MRLLTTLVALRRLRSVSAGIAVVTLALYVSVVWRTMYPVPKWLIEIAPAEGERLLVGVPWTDPPMPDCVDVEAEQVTNHGSSSTARCSLGPVAFRFHDYIEMEQGSRGWTMLGVSHGFDCIRYIGIPIPDPPGHGQLRVRFSPSAGVYAFGCGIERPAEATVEQATSDISNALPRTDRFGVTTHSDFVASERFLRVVTGNSVQGASHGQRLNPRPQTLVILWQSAPLTPALLAALALWRRRRLRPDASELAYPWIESKVTHDGMLCLRDGASLPSTTPSLPAGPALVRLQQTAASAAPYRHVAADVVAVRAGTLDDLRITVNNAAQRREIVTLLWVVAASVPVIYAVCSLLAR